MRPVCNLCFSGVSDSHKSRRFPDLSLYLAAMKKVYEHFCEHFVLKLAAAVT